MLKFLSSCAAVCVLVGGAAYAYWPEYESKVSSSVRIELGTGHGTGTKIGEDLFLTAAHVVGDNKKVRIKIQTGFFVDGEVLFVDAKRDLAVVKAKVEIATSRVACEIVPVKTEIEIYGNPMNMEFVHTWGRISSEPRKNKQMESAYLVSATMISGNSGGGAFDAEGNLIGVISALQLIDLSPENPNPAFTITGLGYVIDGPTICKFLDENKLTYEH